MNGLFFNFLTTLRLPEPLSGSLSALFHHNFRKTAAKVFAFIRHGLPASDLYGRGDDAMVERVIAAKREAQKNG